MNTGKIISDLREQKGWAKKDLVEKSGISRVMIGKCERGEAVSSIEAVKIADALEVSLDYLLPAYSLTAFNKRTLDRIHELEQLEEDKKHTLYDLIDSYIRDAKTRNAYAQ